MVSNAENHILLSKITIIGIQQIAELLLKKEMVFKEGLENILGERPGGHGKPWITKHGTMAGVKPSVTNFILKYCD